MDLKLSSAMGSAAVGAGCNKGEGEGCDEGDAMGTGVAAEGTGSVVAAGGGEGVLSSLSCVPSFTGVLVTFRDGTAAAESTGSGGASDEDDAAEEGVTSKGFLGDSSGACGCGCGCG